MKNNYEDDNINTVISCDLPALIIEIITTERGMWQAVICD